MQKMKLAKCTDSTYCLTSPNLVQGSYYLSQHVDNISFMHAKRYVKTTDGGRTRGGARKRKLRERKGDGGREGRKEREEQR